MTEESVTVKAELAETGEQIEYSVPLGELIPVATGDQFKKAVEKIRSEQRGTRWGTEWRAAATSRQEYIENVKNNPQYFQELAAAYQGRSNPNLFSFQNSGGILNGGVCWWHSRFQRAALYLTLYLPDETRPTSSEAKQIIWKIMKARAVIEIPGFSNFSEFSAAFQEEIQRCLNATQLIEGVFLSSWINGLAGLSKVTEKKMRTLMDKILVHPTKAYFVS